MIRLSTVIALAALLFVGESVVAPEPAKAGGGVRVEITPNGRQAEAIRMGLGIYGLVQRSRNRARIDQRGSSNAAGIRQRGQGNFAGVFQNGQGHTTTVEQNGNNSAIGVFQFGRNRSSRNVQNGDGQVGLIIEGGW